MPGSISKGALLSILINRGYTSPNEKFLKETEQVLYEELLLDKNELSDKEEELIKQSAQRFFDSVKAYYAKYHNLDSILKNNKVRRFTTLTLQKQLLFIVLLHCKLKEKLIRLCAFIFRYSFQLICPILPNFKPSCLLAR